MGILAEHTSQTGSGWGMLWPREPIGTSSWKVGTGSAPDDSMGGMFPSEPLPEMPLRHWLRGSEYRGG